MKLFPSRQRAVRVAATTTGSAKLERLRGCAAGAGEDDGSGAQGGGRQAA